MAAPITHIVLTKKIYNQHFSDKSFNDFIIGTSLPDIRYLGTIDRNKTHFPNAALNETKQEKSFTAGLKLHSIVDRVRENFLLSYDLYSKCPESKFITQSIKFLEDSTLYAKIDNWENYIELFNNVLQSELEVGLNRQTVDYWHRTLQDYFSRQPDNKSIDTFVKRIKLGQEVADEIKENIEIISKNPEVLNYINSLYKQFEDLVLEKSSQHRS
ncbi:hypothetical protein H6802_03585 [Candidatus Nomurabacteria bacterium]|nr:hypothetical protein [Candidatus Nomurabacteria bacterium]MCB9827018.1 hypothetical protein [Candidatus Nomurabacteria bacterium]MCB9827952.1 hypothetical protein [Candidatus Nomurabacteria bacterium]